MRPTGWPGAGKPCRVAFPVSMCAFWGEACLNEMCLGEGPPCDRALFWGAGGDWTRPGCEGGGGGGGRGAWTAKTVKRPWQQPAHPQYANYWAPMTRKRHTMPHSAQPQHTNYWAPRTRKRHQQEHRPQQLTERNALTQHAKGRTGDCPWPRKETTTRRNVTQGGVPLSGPVCSTERPQKVQRQTGPCFGVSLGVGGGVLEGPFPILLP